MKRVRFPIRMIGAMAIGLAHLPASAEVQTWQFGGFAGQVWGDFTNPAAFDRLLFNTPSRADGGQVNRCVNEIRRPSS